MIVFKPLPSLIRDTYIAEMNFLFDGDMRGFFHFFFTNFFEYPVIKGKKEYMNEMKQIFDIYQDLTGKVLNKNRNVFHSVTRKFDFYEFEKIIHTRALFDFKTIDDLKYFCHAIKTTMKKYKNDFDECEIFLPVTFSYKNKADDIYHIAYSEDFTWYDILFYKNDIFSTSHEIVKNEKELMKLLTYLNNNGFKIEYPIIKHVKMQKEHWDYFNKCKKEIESILN